jgi:mono/diheme cytochrome c family protein
MQSLHTWWASSSLSARRTPSADRQPTRAARGLAAAILAASLAATLLLLPFVGGCSDDQTTDATAGGTTVQSTEAGDSGDSDTTTSAAPAGDRLYSTLCAGCHGSDGQSDFSPAIVGLDAEVVRAAVSQGKGDMAGFADSLSPEEIDAIVVYVGTLE